MSLLRNCTTSRYSQRNTTSITTAIESTNGSKHGISTTSREHRTLQSRKDCSFPACFTTMWKHSTTSRKKLFCAPQIVLKTTTPCETTAFSYLQLSYVSSSFHSSLMHSTPRTSVSHSGRRSHAVHLEESLFWKDLRLLASLNPRC